MQRESYKQCTKCGGEKPLDCFYRIRKFKNSHSSWCRECRARLMRESYWRGRERPPEPKPPFPLDDIDPAFGHWLAGFIDGEGCFVIVRHHSEWGPRWRCQFAVHVRADDHAIIEAARATTRIGCVNWRKARYTHVNGMPGIAWVINDRRGIEALIALLDRYPLRSKKARDFAIWRQAAEEWAKVTRSGDNRALRNRPHWDRMGDLAATLVAVRQYVHPDHAPVPPPK